MAWIELFTTDIGLLSLFTISFILVMAAYLIRYVKQHMAAEMNAGMTGHQVPGAH